MSISITEDIRPITDLKRNSQEIINHIHETKRPVVLTVNGRTEAVIVDAGQYEKLQKAVEISKLLREAEQDVDSGNVRKTSVFFKEFKREKKISN